MTPKPLTRYQIPFQRPRGIERMTYIAAFGCKDGVVMCADIQEIIGDRKNYVEKLVVVDKYPLAVGGAGFGRLIDCFTDEIITQATADFPHMKKDLKRLIQNALDEVYAMDLPTLVTTKQLRSPNC